MRAAAHPGKPLRSGLGVTTLLVVAPILGCSQYIDPNVPEPIRPFFEPEYGRPYLLYRPSSYDRRQRWPLVVVCHASFPDSPHRAIRDWTQLAETHGFLVAAPRLKAGSRSLLRSTPKQVSLQKEDERCILAMIRHIRAGHSLSEDRILIHGWSGGARTALYTGLRHPDVFRAVSLIQPRFQRESLVDVESRIDPYQPILVCYSVDDVFTGKHGRRCVDWLRSHGAQVREDAIGPARRSDARRVVQFYETVIRKEPWIRIRALPRPGDNPLDIQFKLQCTPRPTQYRWAFGDGDESTVAEPIHTYAKPGTYRVAVTIVGPKGRTHRRTVTLRVPGAGLRPERPR